MRIRKEHPALVIALQIAAACGGTTDSPSEAGWQAVVDTLGDTITVRTVSGSVWGGAATLVPEISIGVMEGADEYIIGDPRSLAVAADGTILVLDVQIPALRVYGPDGGYLRDIGREGSGPGEYDSPDAMAVLPDGRIIVRDPPNSRISVFSPDGEWLEQWPLAGGFNTSRRFYVDTSGRSYATTLLERGTSPWNWKYGLVRYTADGEILDTVPAPVWDHDVAQLTASREGSSSRRLVPYTAQVSWTFSPLGYMVGGLSTDYRVDLFQADGRVLRLERDWTPVPVAAEEADERRRRITQGLQRQYGSWRWNGPDVPDTKAPFKELFVSEQGNVWVTLSTAGVARMSAADAREEEQASGRLPLRFWEPPAFDVFDPDGRFLGHVQAPESLGIEPEPIVRGDYVWAVVRDDLDVASVVRFRIALP